MKRITMSLAAMLLMATLSVPAHAQDDKEKTKDKEVKETKKNSEQIIITRKIVKDEKVVIEIQGDKITINGKPIEDLKDGDISVHRNKSGNYNAFSFTPGQGGYWNDFDQNNGLLYNIGENRAMLGVVTEDADKGVEITEIIEKSAAAKAGLKKGDVITKINDTKISDPDQLSETIRKQKPGDKVTVTYLRNDKEQKLTTELGKGQGLTGLNKSMQFPEFKALEDFHGRADVAPRIGSPYGQTFSWSGNGPKLGLSVQDTDDGKGVKVLEIDEESNAAKAGLKEGDLITHLNDKEVNGADEVAKLVRENKDKVSIKLQIKRNGKTENVEVKMPRKIKTADL